MKVFIRNIKEAICMCGYDGEGRRGTFVLTVTSPLIPFSRSNAMSSFLSPTQIQEMITAWPGHSNTNNAPVGMLSVHRNGAKVPFSVLSGKASILLRKSLSSTFTNPQDSVDGIPASFDGLTPMIDLSLRLRKADGSIKYPVSVVNGSTPSDSRTHVFRHSQSLGPDGLLYTYDFESSGPGGALSEVYSTGFNYGLGPKSGLGRDGSDDSSAVIMNDIMQKIDAGSFAVGPNPEISTIYYKAIIVEDFCIDVATESDIDLPIANDFIVVSGMAVQMAATALYSGGYFAKNVMLNGLYSRGLEVVAPISQLIKGGVRSRTLRPVGKLTNLDNWTEYPTLFNRDAEKMGAEKGQGFLVTLTGAISASPLGEFGFNETGNYDLLGKLLDNRGITQTTYPGP